MQADQNNVPGKADEANFSPAGTGNASNPAPQDGAENSSNQLLNKKAEKYLRESGSIEDLPDEQDWQDADAVIKKEKEGKGNGQ